MEIYVFGAIQDIFMILRIFFTTTERKGLVTREQEGEGRWHKGKEALGYG